MIHSFAYLTYLSNFFIFIENHILLLLLILPILGSIILLFEKKNNISSIKEIGLDTSLITFLTSLYLWLNFDNSANHFQFVDDIHWIPFYNLNFTLGIDGISLFFILLTTFLIPICLLTGWNSVKIYIKEYFIAFLITETLLIAVFSVLDLLLFYIFFESILIPMFLIIGIWGARERKIHAAYQFFLYTLFGSVLMLLGIILIYKEVGTTHVEILLTTSFNVDLQKILWLAFFASFAVKVPMIPVHIWLPEAHVEAPTAGSVLLAGILLKLGTYGFLRFSIPMFPEATIFFTPLIYTMSVIAIIYTSLITLRQIDLKKIIAYASVGHMNFVTLGIFSLNIQGIEGSLLVMLSHGIVSSALFLCVGILYDRYKTRIMKYYRGLTLVMPLFSITFLFFTLANMSVPGTSSFVGEFLILNGIFQVNVITTLLASTGIILGAAYSIWLYNRIAFGMLSKYIIKYNDMNKKEIITILPFIFLTLFMGIYPDVFLDTMHVSVTNLLSNYR
jgi:proton-translocating NADH-quinone oxidoreductase chain M